MRIWKTKLNPDLHVQLRGLMKRIWLCSGGKYEHGITGVNILFIHFMQDTAEVRIPYPACVHSLMFMLKVDCWNRGRFWGITVYLCKGNRLCFAINAYPASLWCNCQKCRWTGLEMFWWIWCKRLSFLLWLQSHLWSCKSHIKELSMQIYPVWNEFYTPTYNVFHIY